MLSLLLISSLFLATCGAQNFSLPASPLETVADSNGRLFVSTAGVGAGEGGRVYRLSGDSLREEEVLQLPAGDGVLRMALSSDHSRLVVCFANRSCSVYNSSDLNAGAQRTVADVSLSSSSMALFTAPVSGGGDSFYAASVGVTPDPQDIRLVQYGFAGAENSVERSSDLEYVLQPSSDLGRTFVGGFVEDSSAYFVAVDTDPSAIRALHVMRVCDTSGENGFPAVYEAELNCGVSTSLDTKVPSVSVVRNPGETWVVLSTSQPGSGNNRVCSFLLSSIDQELDETYTTCRDPLDSTDIPLSWFANIRACNDFSPTGPCNFEIAASIDIPALAGFDAVGATFFIGLGTNDGITASVAFNVEAFSLVYVAYTESPGVHHLRAYDITSGAPLGLSGSFSDQVLESQVRTLALGPGLEHLFVTDDSNSVFLVPLEECSSYGDCGGCVASSNPLCGWCTLEQKCSRQSQCQNSNETKRYVLEPAQCINASVSPDQFISEQPEILEVSLSSALPPLLPGESYECVLTSEEGGVEIAVDAVSSTSTTYSCNITGPLPPKLEIVTNFNLRSTLVQELFATVVDAVTLYQCPLALSCSKCLQTEGACGWCVYDKTCSVLNSTCRNETDFYTVNMGMGQTYQEVCPALLPSPMRADGYYTQPAGVGRPLQLNTTNLPQEIEGYSYVCRVSRSNGGQVDLPATYNSPDSLTCTVDASDLPLPSGREETVGLSIVWQGPGGLNRALDEQDGGANLVLYQCSQLAQGCSSCLGANINTSFTCGWCGSTCQVMEDSCSGGSFAEVSAGCPSPTVTGVDPPAGPLEGGTTLTITGTDLGTQASDIASVTVGGSECVIDQGGYKTGTQVACETGSVSAVGPNTNLVVSVMRSGGPAMDGTSAFSYLQPMVGSVSPVFGPMAGGTKVVVTGTDLDIGNKQNTRVQLGRTECTELSISSGQLNCTSASDMLGGGPVMVFIDNAVVSNVEVEFSSRNNPSYESVSPMNTIPAGGVILTFTGMDLDVAQRPTFVFTNSLPSSVGGRQVNQGPVVCNASGDGTSLECVVPPLPASLGVGEGGAVPYDIIMDAAPGPNASFVPALQFTSRPNPNPVMLRESDQMYTADSGDLIEILGQNLDSVQKSEYRVTVGGEECVLDFVGPDRLSCLPPQESPSSDESEFQVMVFVGQNLGPFDVGSLSYVPGLDIIPIIAGVGGGVVGIVLFFLLVICIVVCCYQRKGKEKEKKVQNLLSQMEHWELEMADECKRAFTELQTDLADLVQISDRNFPFRDFRSFAMRFLFPSAGDDHPVLNPLALPPGYSQEDVVPHLETFKDLLMDKKFLLSFVRTLEAQGGGFTLQDRCNVASLLMVVFQNNLIYATDILQTLLSELMQKSIGRGHPKLLLRRTESVAEKMLANWLCFLLYPHILEHAGEPLFILYRAIKSQLEKGPVDVITGEAKHSLSEEKLLRQHLDFMPVEGVIETAGEEKIPIKLLDTDSITQAKEKILDTLYKNAPVSSRPQLTDVDLELRQSGAGITLRDQDQTNITEGDWMKVNTLGHFKLAEMSKAHLDNPKYPQPKFMLVPRPTRPVSGVSQLDMLGTIIANMSVTSRSSLITSGELAHVYHLVKPEPEVGNEESALRHTKIMSEVFLSRLLSTKRILQPYVDDLFNAVFTIPRGKLLPPAIKSLFDFLDLQAAQLNIEDPEVLHTWKTNSLPLRFWVNLIKNPDFIFDINKSATVDACLTVIAQAYIDACSTAEQRYSKDTPTARLLYVNEVKKYKEHIRMYYDTIQSLPKLLPSELEEHLRETAQVCSTSVLPHSSNQNKPPHNQLFFVTESALMELYKYALEYSADLTDTLNEDGLTETVEVFDKLKANLHIKS